MLKMAALRDKAEIIADHLAIAECLALEEYRRELTFAETTHFTVNVKDKAYMDSIYATIPVGTHYLDVLTFYYLPLVRASEFKPNQRRRLYTRLNALYGYRKLNPMFNIFFKAYVDAVYLHAGDMRLVLKHLGLVNSMDF